MIIFDMWSFALKLLSCCSMLRHAHQLSPVAYNQDCLAILKKELNHDDTVSGRDPGQKVYRLQRRLWIMGGNLWKCVRKGRLHVERRLAYLCRSTNRWIKGFVQQHVGVLKNARTEYLFIWETDCPGIITCVLTFVGISLLSRIFLVINGTHVVSGTSPWQMSRWLHSTRDNTREVPDTAS